MKPLGKIIRLSTFSLTDVTIYDHEENHQPQWDIIIFMQSQNTMTSIWHYITSFLECFKNKIHNKKEKNFVKKHIINV
jgi:hypothetical protein